MHHPSASAKCQGKNSAFAPKSACFSGRKALHAAQAKATSLHRSAGANCRPHIFQRVSALRPEKAPMPDRLSADRPPSSQSGPSCLCTAAQGDQDAGLFSGNRFTKLSVHRAGRFPPSFCPAPSLLCLPSATGACARKDRAKPPTSPGGNRAGMCLPRRIRALGKTAR